MENPLEAYIVQARSSGFNDNQIKQTLMGVGWNPNLIDETLQKLPGGINFDEQKVKAELKNWLKSVFKSQLGHILILMSLTVAGTLLALAEPWPNKFLVDSVFGDVPAPGFLSQWTGTIQLLYFVAFLMLGLFLLQSLLNLITSRLELGFGFQLEKQIKSHFFGHVLRLPVSYKARLQSGDYIYRQNAETSEITGFVLGAPVGIFGALLSIISSLFVMAVLNLELTLVSLIIVPVLYFSTKFFGPKLQARSMQTEMSNSRVYAHSTESIENAKLVQTFGKEDYQNSKLVALMNDSFINELKIMYLGQGFNFVNGFVVMMGIFIVVFVGGQQIFDGSLFFGELLIFLTYMNNLYGPIEALSDSMTRLKESYSVIERVFEVLNDHAEVDTKESRGYIIEEFNDSLVFENASILHDGQPALENINLTIKKGQRIGLIGPSGSGKSTLLNVVPLFNDYSGSIKIDGVELHDINPKSLRTKISFVDQNPHLFSDSIYNNIQYAIDVQATPEQIQAAAKVANAHDFIMMLPNHYYTNVGEAGQFLSGGQLQRIAIARSFLRNSPILLLDEPTSALDVESENIVIDTISQLMKHKTVIMITHKLSLLSQMDEVYVVDNKTIKNVKDYGGVERYNAYLQAHELVQ